MERWLLSQDTMLLDPRKSAEIMMASAPVTSAEPVTAIAFGAVPWLTVPATLPKETIRPPREFPRQAGQNHGDSGEGKKPPRTHRSKGEQLALLRQRRRGHDAPSPSIRAALP